MRKILSLIFAGLLLASAAFAAATNHGMFKIDFEKSDLQKVLQVYADLSRLEIIESPEVQKLHTLVTVHPDHRVTLNEAIKLIEDAVKEQAGVTITRFDDMKVSGFTFLAAATLAKK